MPPTIGITSITGRSGSDLWIVATAVPQGKPILLRNSGNAGWSSTPIDYGVVFDMALFGQDDGLMTASRTLSLGQGVALRLMGDWSKLPMPSVGENVSFSEATRA